MSLLDLLLGLLCGHGLLDSWLLHHGLLLSLGWCSSLLLGLLLLSGLLLLDVVGVDVLLDIQERHLCALRWVQQLLQSCIQRDVLASLQTLLGDIVVNLTSHLRAGNQLTLRQLQKLPELRSHLQRLVETVVLATRLALLASGILDESLHLTQILTDRLQLLHQVIESHGGSGGGHFYYTYHAAL